MKIDPTEAKTVELNVQDKLDPELKDSKPVKVKKSFYIKKNKKKV